MSSETFKQKREVSLEERDSARGLEHHLAPLIKQFIALLEIKSAHYCAFWHLQILKWTHKWQLQQRLKYCDWRHIFYKSTIFNLMWCLTNTTHMVSDAEKAARPDSLLPFLSISLFWGGNLVYFIKFFFSLSHLLSGLKRVTKADTNTKESKTISYTNTHKHTHILENKTGLKT